VAAHRPHATTAVFVLARMLTSRLDIDPRPPAHHGRPPVRDRYELRKLSKHIGELAKSGAALPVVFMHRNTVTFV